MEDEEDMWANTTNPSALPTAASTCSSISTALNLNSTHLHLYSGASPPHSRDNNYNGSMGCAGGAGYRNAVASPASFSSAGSYPHIAPLDAGPARRALEREMCLGHAAAPWAGAGAAAAGGGDGADRRKKCMIKNRESAARSRARKQAHVSELEREVQYLQQENEKLRVKYEQLRESVEVQVPVKSSTLQRVLSAPF
uniref:FD-like protein n=1 Tax=Sasa veitchii var. hirsuta TaxID=403585 RepID=A0A0K2QPS3_9POAL|nr:FD-like gene [Sasa veitchii var. hirsuta]